MKGDINLRELKVSNLSVSKRKVLVIASCVVAAAALWLGWRYLNHPPRPWLVRWKLDRYLKSESHARDFKVDFPFPSKAEMAKAPTTTGPSVGAKTGKTFEALRDEYLVQKTAAVKLETAVVRAEAEGKDAAAQRAEWQAKEQALAPIVDDLWEFQKAVAAQAAFSDSSPAGTLAKARADFVDNAEKTLRSAPSYDAMYKVIGQELFVAKGLLASKNSEHRKHGITVALAAARHAAEFAVNGGVAARIAEGYILPNLDVANDPNRRSPFNEQNLVNQCADIFSRNYEYNNVVRTYEIYLDGLKNPMRADWVHERIGNAHENAGDLKAALAAYREIKDTNSYRNVFQRQIPRIERQLKG